MDITKLPPEAIHLIAGLQEQINYLRNDLTHANKIMDAMHLRLQEVDPDYHQTIRWLRTVELEPTPGRRRTD